MLAYAPSKVFAFVAIGVGTLSNVGFPAISSIKANNVQDYEQGLIQGALYAAKSLAQGIGPITFAALFSLFSRSDSPLPYFPGAPFLFGAGLSLVAVLVASTIDSESADRGVQQLPEVHYEDLDNEDAQGVSAPGSPTQEGAMPDSPWSSPITPDVKKPALSVARRASSDKTPTPQTPEPWPGHTARMDASSDAVSCTGEGEGGASIVNVSDSGLRVPSRIVWARPEGGEILGAEEVGRSIPPESCPGHAMLRTDASCEEGGGTGTGAGDGNISDSGLRVPGRFVWARPEGGQVLDAEGGGSIPAHEDVKKFSPGIPLWTSRRRSEAFDRAYRPKRSQAVGTV
eukprot:jgi/Botrbrau1/17650/Bobra.0166s0078.1